MTGDDVEYNAAIKMLIWNAVVGSIFYFLALPIISFTYVWKSKR